MLGHQNGLYLDLTVGENVRFWGATVGRHRRRDRRRDGAARASPGGSPTCRSRKLSAGQKRRTALACLVARRAQLWLLDEPHAGLDAAGRDELDATLRQAAAAGATIVVASHELERAGSLATRAVDVVAGRVHEVVDPARTTVMSVLAHRSADRPQGSADRAAQPRRHQPGPAVRRVTMVMFAFALDSDDLLERVAPGLVWLATMFSLLVLVQRRSPSRPTTARSTPCASPGSTPGDLPRQDAALAVQLLVLEVVLLVAGDRPLRPRCRSGGAVLLVTTLVSATCGLAAVGTL